MFLLKPKTVGYSEIYEVLILGISIFACSLMMPSFILGEIMLMQNLVSIIFLVFF